MGDLIRFQQMGFGVAVALLIDATIVPGVLVPAAMKLLGRRSWYLPRWLLWLPDAHVEGASRDARAMVRLAAPALRGEPALEIGDGFATFSTKRLGSPAPTSEVTTRSAPP
jgi:hypothetical protein